MRGHILYIPSRETGITSSLSLSFSWSNWQGVRKPGFCSPHLGSVSTFAKKKKKERTKRTRLAASFLPSSLLFPGHWSAFTSTNMFHSFWFPILHLPFPLPGMLFPSPLPDQLPFCPDSLCGPQVKTVDPTTMHSQGNLNFFLYDSRGIVLIFFYYYGKNKKINPGKNTLANWLQLHCLNKTKRSKYT